MNGLVQFVNITKRLQNQEIYSALKQRRNLLAENISRFLKRQLPQRLNANTEGSDRASYPAIKTFGRLLRQARAVKIDVMNFVLQPMPFQPNRISTESVGFNYLGSSLQIFVVNPSDQVRLRDIQFVITAVYEDALGIKQRAHRAITQYR
jgi:hypothetical protein